MSASPLIKKLAIFALGACTSLLISKVLKSYWAMNQNVESTHEHPVNESIITYGEDGRDYDAVEEIMFCPISGSLMKHPWVLAECGHSFERKQIVGWLSKQNNCPLCNTKADIKNMKPNFQLKQVIRAYEQNRNQIIISQNAGNI